MGAIVDILLLLVAVLIFVLIWRGPTMLPRLGEAMGRTVKGVRDNLPGTARDATDETTTADERDADSQRGS
jgi:Sec-independent protein translocase protein TatA